MEELQVRVRSRGGVVQRLRHAAGLVQVDLRVSKIGKISANFAKFWRACSRLYQNEILQENMRLKALAEIYTMHSFALL